MLVAIAKLDARKKHRSLASTLGISRQSVEGAIERTVVRHIYRVEPGARVPFPVSLGIEPGASIVRCVGVTVKVDRD
jgi:hypothetical protein